MKTPTNAFDRRRFLTTTAGLGAVAAATPWVLPGQGVCGTPSQRIKVGQIGLGHAHAAGKMATLRKLSDQYEVVGVVESNPEWRRTRGEDPAYQGLTWMTEEQLLNIKGLQVVAVETEVRDLVPTAARCIDAGLHVHLDKPGGESFGDFRKLLDASARRSRVVQMGYMFRNNPALQFCFEAVRQGWLGKIFEVDCVMSKLPPEAERKSLSRYRGGAMFEFGGHLIDLLLTVLGKPERIVASQRRTHPETDDLYDHGLAVFEYRQALATIRTSVVEVAGEQRRQFVVCGDEGTIDIRPIEPPKLRLALSGPRGRFRGGYQDVALPAMPGRYDDQLLELAQVVRGEKPNPYSREHDLAVQEALLTASGYALSE